MALVLPREKGSEGDNRMTIATGDSLYRSTVPSLGRVTPKSWIAIEDLVAPNFGI